MPTIHSITSILQNFINGELWRIFALCCVALSALFLGMNIGYFVVLWIEWGPILGGLALAGSVFFVPATGRKLQIFPKLFFVSGLALAGAGVSDLLNFPKSNSDIYSGLLTGMACGFVLALIIWRSANTNKGDRFIFTSHPWHKPPHLTNAGLYCTELVSINKSLKILLHHIQTSSTENNSRRLG